MNAGHVMQLGTILCIDFRAALHYLGHMLELQQPKSSIDFAHLGVNAWRDNGGFIDKAEILKMIDALLGFCVRTDNGAAFEGIEYLGGVKTQHRQITMTQHTAATVLHAKGVGGIVNHAQIVVVGDFLNGFYIAGIAIAMHWHESSGLWGNCGFDLGGVKVEGIGLNVDKHGFIAMPQQRVRCGNEGIWSCNDLTGYSKRLEGGDERQGTIGEQGHVLDTEVFAQGLLQLLVEGATVGQDLIVPDFLKVRRKVFQGRKMWLSNVDGFCIHTESLAKAKGTDACIEFF